MGPLEGNSAKCLAHGLARFALYGLEMRYSRRPGHRVTFAGPDRQARPVFPDVSDHLAVERAMFADPAALLRRVAGLAHLLFASRPFACAQPH